MQHQKKSTIHLNKYVLVEFVLVCLALVGCVVVYSKTCTAEIVTRQYLEAYAVADYEQMFQCLLLDEMDRGHVTKKSFQAAGEVCYNYQSLPVQTVTSVWKTKGNYREATVYAQYTNSEGEQSAFIQLKKTGLFWKVVERKLENPIMQEIVIGVPRNSELIIDGLPIDRTTYSHTENEIDWYQLKGAFGGTHLVQCFHQDREMYEGVRDFSAAGGKITCLNYLNMPLKEKQYLELENCAIKDWTKILATVAGYDEKHVLQQSIEPIKESVYTHWGWQSIQGYVIAEDGYTCITNQIKQTKNAKELIEEFAVRLHPVIKEVQEGREENIIQNNVSVELIYIKEHNSWKLIKVKK